MISNNYIPEKINDANAYLDGTRMIGVAASVDLPEVNMKTGTVEGFGVGGEIDSPTIGQWESFEQEVQFNTLYSSAVDMLNPLTVVNLTFRAAQQVYDKTGGYDFKGLRVVEMGRVKKFKPGKIEKSEGIQGIITVIMTIGSVVVPALLAGFESFSAGISAVMSAIQGIFQGLITFITGVFSGSWSQAWEGIKQIFGSAFDGLVALCKTPLNAVIAIINKAISGINGLGLTIPGWVPILGGKSFSINIPALPMLAKGGFTDGVSIAGEAGTEAVISFQRGVRSDNINTWTQAGRMLGVSGEQAAVAAGVPYADGGGAVELATLDATQDNNAVELQEIDTGKPQPEQDGGGTPDGGGQVVFAPQITVQGNADRAVLESVLDDAQQRFELWYEQMMRRKARTAY